MLVTAPDMGAHAPRREVRREHTSWTLFISAALDSKRILCAILSRSSAISWLFPVSEP